MALGAIVAPPDAIAATAVAARLAVPRRILTILEGESLLNDATALTIYSVVLAAAARRFSAGEALATFALALVGGVAIGLAVGWIVAQIRARLDDTPVEMTISLVTPYAAFLPAAQLGVSGVIAAVTAGLFLAREGSRIMGPDTRLTGRPVWETITFLLNGFVFIVTGLAVPPILRSLAAAEAMRLIGIGVVVTAVLVAVRAVWILGMVYLLPAIGGPARSPTWRAEVVVLSWAGMRGVVSLAAALALPVTLADGRPLVARDAIVIVTLTVIILTLVGQGLTLPWLIRALRLGGDSEIREEESRARQEILAAAARRVDELYSVWPGHHPLLDQLRTTYQHRSEHVDRARDPASGARTRSSSSIARSGGRSSALSARLCSGSAPRKRSTTTSCASSSESSISRSKASTPEARLPPPPNNSSVLSAVPPTDLGGPMGSSRRPATSARPAEQRWPPSSREAWANRGPRICSPTCTTRWPEACPSTPISAPSHSPFASAPPSGWWAP